MELQRAFEQEIAATRTSRWRIGVPAKVFDIMRLTRGDDCVVPGRQQRVARCFRERPDVAFLVGDGHP